MRFRSYKRNKIGIFFTRGIFLIILSFMCSIMVIKYFSGKANEILIPMAEAKLKKIVSTVINAATKDVKFNDNLFTIDKDETDEIKMITYNSYEVISLLDEITLNIQDELDKLIDRESLELSKFTIQEVPFGVILGSTFLRNLGPRIKLKSEFIGSIISNVETEVKPYGINNAYVECRIYLEVSAMVYLPFITKEVIISNVIPISMNIVQGNVPNGYITSYKQ